MGIKDFIGYGVTLIGWIVLLVSKFNDLKHLKKDFEDFRNKYDDDKKVFWKKIDKVQDDVEDVKNKVVGLEARCDERHKK